MDTVGVVWLQLDIPWCLPPNIVCCHLFDGQRTIAIVVVADEHMCGSLLLLPWHAMRNSIISMRNLLPHILTCAIIIIDSEVDAAMQQGVLEAMYRSHYMHQPQWSCWCLVRRPVSRLSSNTQWLLTRARTSYNCVLTPHFTKITRSH